MVQIREASVDEVFDASAFAALCDEYRAESLRNPQLRGGLPERAGYAQLVQAGMLRVLGAFAGPELVGFCAVLIAPVLHFGGRVIASTETLFVASAHRATGTGLALLRAAEQVALEAGAGGLYVSAPSGGRLERVLPRVGYRESNRVYYRSLTEEL